jgi:Uri superfamily endonuclease
LAGLRGKVIKGSYILLLELPQDENIGVGSLGHILLPQASYAYVGSAMNGLEGRISHHLKTKKRLHWHIDYLREKATILEVALFPGCKRIECLLAFNLSRHFPSVPGFGSSDCRCSSHLFWGEKEKLRQKVYWLRSKYAFDLPADES